MDIANDFIKTQVGLKMNRTKIKIDLSEFPAEFHSIIGSADIYDSSCSETARVYFIDKDKGYFLKSAPKGELQREAEMTSYFFSKGLAARVLGYVSVDRDWFLCERVGGEDGAMRENLKEPNKLCDAFAEILRDLHEIDGKDCPVLNRTGEYLKNAYEGYRKGKFDASIFPAGMGFSNADDAYKYLCENARYLKNDTLIHGDYCLPNVMFRDGSFSGFIDLGNSGMGDRHIDLFWGAWTLWYNLKTTEYTDRFFDAYGREKVDKDVLRLVAAAEVFG